MGEKRKYDRSCGRGTLKLPFGFPPCDSTKQVNLLCVRLLRQLGRATNFQIPTKLSANIHPDWRQTACWVLLFISHLL